MTQPDGRSVDLKLTHDEALVLFEWTHRQEDEHYNGKFFIDAAEQVAVWNLTASLEPLIEELFSSTYREALQAAKSRLVGEVGPPAE